MAEERGPAQGLSVSPGHGQSPVEHRPSHGSGSPAGAVVGAGSNSCRDSSAAGRRQSGALSGQEASQLWRPAGPKGCPSFRRWRVGMCRGRSWSSPGSEVALGLGLSRAHSRHSLWSHHSCPHSPHNLHNPNHPHIPHSHHNPHNPHSHHSHHSLHSPRSLRSLHGLQRSHRSHLQRRELLPSPRRSAAGRS